MRSRLLLLGFVTLLLFSGVVSAVVVDCSRGGWFNTPVCMDYELQDEFDEVTDTVDGVHWEVHRNYDLIGETQDVISDSSVLWSTDKKGVSFGRMSEFVFGKAYDFFKTVFVSLSDYNSEKAALEERVSSLELRVKYMGLGYTDLYQKGVLWYGTSPRGELVRLV